MVSDVLFSRNSDEWETPQDLFDTLNGEFNFFWDAAATGENTKCNHGHYFDKLGCDALTTDWPRLPVWLNPPHSKWQEFVKKAYEESLKGTTVVCLIPSRTDTKAWHDYVMRAYEIRFIKGRLKFGDSKNSAPFPSCVVVFKGDQSILEFMAGLDGPANVRSIDTNGNATS